MLDYHVGIMYPNVSQSKDNKSNWEKENTDRFNNFACNLL